MPLVDDDDFDLGAPTLLEMWKHQVVLVTNEAEYLTHELVKARQNIAKLVEMNEALSKDLQALQMRTLGKAQPMACGASGGLPLDRPVHLADSPRQPA
ncbi:hypothetical protein [Pseudomonas fontis]|uniref:Uncharacterized protein n=1 Tax=Pseudomonas fontis TaxID=2942633 RepID=A0ABT5NMI6_9PSED|nr:hypothetical protein [Pseudomonas fontis]MDD0976204.1 hypothetical protein [Pseudomonas fontis]MDD0989033.1 hypothetical protein [Pseudomonas fontis]